MTHARRGPRFSLSHVRPYLHTNLVPNAAQKLLTFVWHFVAFSPTCAHVNGEDGARGATALLHGRGSKGGYNYPLAGYDSFFLVCSSIFTCKIGLNCSEMLHPANSAWNFVATAHLHYLKIISRFFVER